MLVIMPFFRILTDMHMHFVHPTMVLFCDAHYGDFFVFIDVVSMDFIHDAMVWFHDDSYVFC